MRTLESSPGLALYPDLTMKNSPGSQPDPSPNRLRTLFRLAIFIIASGSSFANADSPFARQYVDGPDTGFGVSMAYDRAGNPTASYESVSGSIQYAVFNGTDWDVTTVVADAGSASPKALTALAFSSENHPAIAFQDRNVGHLKIAEYDGEMWNISTIDSTTICGEFCTIVADSNGKYHVAYNDATNKNLKYATNVGGAWLPETVDNTTDTGFFNSIDLYSNNSPGICYYENTDSALKYAYKDEHGAWIKVTVDSEGDTGAYCSLAIGLNENLHIVYVNLTEYEVVHAEWDGFTWTYLTLDDRVVNYLYCSIALNGANQPAVCYIDFTNGNLYYGVRSAGFWDFQIASEGYAFTSLAFDNTGSFPLIGFQYNSDPEYGFMGVAFVPRPPPVVSAVPPAAADSALKVAVTTKIKKLKKKIKKLKKARNSRKAAASTKKLKKLKKLLKSL